MRAALVAALLLVAAAAVATDVPLPARRLVITNAPAPENPAKRTISWLVTDAGVVAPSIGSADDPRCVDAGGGGGGATIRFFSDGSAGSTEDTGDIPLPCGHWALIGSARSPRGYAYVDRDQADGPCERVVVRGGRRVAARCTGRSSVLTYDLVSGRSENDVATALVLGTTRQCTLAAAPSGTDGSDGKAFRAANAPAPARCATVTTTTTSTTMPPTCGNGTRDPGEDCDDGNTAAGDGCSPTCTFEPLCLVTHDGGNPVMASVVKILPDGTLTPVSNVTLAGALHHDASIARCGRYVYLNVDGGVAGFAVGLDGVLTPVAAVTGLSDDVARLLCSPAQNLLFVFDPGQLLIGYIYAYAVGPSGALTLAATNGGANPSGGRMWAEFHPVTGELFDAGSYTTSGIGPAFDTAYVERSTYDAAGHITPVQQTYLQSGFQPARLGGLRFTADAGALALLGLYDGSNTCFGYFDAPGAVIPPLGTLTKVCTAPFPAEYRGFVPRPEGGPLFYFQTRSSLHAAEFTGSSIVSDASIVPVHDTEQLLLAFDGRVLISLGASASEVATYDVAPDLVTLTPKDARAVGATPRDGVLLPCPDL